MILAVDLGTDLAPAICLAYELAESDLMKRKPRDSKTDRLTNGQLFFLGYGCLGMFETLIGFFCFFGVFTSFGFLHSDLTGAAIDFKKENSALCDQECCPAWCVVLIPNSIFVTFWPGTQPSPLSPTEATKTRRWPRWRSRLCAATAAVA